jgi:hypothetical protein
MLESRLIENKRSRLEYKVNKRERKRQIKNIKKAETPDAVSFYMTLLCLIGVFTILSYFREG